MEDAIAMLNPEVALEALGDGTRRRVLKSVGLGARSVREIADGMNVSRPAVSQHLKVLKDAGLVAVEIRGTRHIYSVDPRGIHAVQRWFEQFWDLALAEFARAAEAAGSSETHEND